MKQLKKRTLALVLASVVTVVGSFAAENYKNCLMALNLRTIGQGSVQVMLETKHAYGSTINAIKKDANTYVVTLPDVNSADTVPITGDMSHVSSINVRTMPYSANGNGYTRVTIKTVGASNIRARSQVYLASNSNKQIAGYAKKTNDSVQKTSSVTPVTKPSVTTSKQFVAESNAVQKIDKTVNNAQPKAENKSDKQVPEKNQAKNGLQEINSQINDTKKNEFFSQEEQAPKKDPTELILLIMGMLLVVAVAIYSYIKAKDQLTQLAGEQITLDLTDENTPAKKKKEKAKKKASSIKGTIKNLDSKYPKNATMIKREEYTISSNSNIEEEPVEEINVVDLDEIFQEQIKTKSEEQNTAQDDSDAENEALEDFLSGFSFNEEFDAEQEEENQLGYDSEFYEKAINNGLLKFSKDDISCINKLLSMEINDGTLREIEKYAVSNPIKKVPTKEKILEDFVTTYAISQNIIFTSEDISALYKLISVEIDKDFINDLRTNPNRTKEMQADILSYGDNPKKSSKILTLNVKDMLPDLSEALRQQGNKKIESNRKPETVYFSEGYDVRKLKISEALPDLSKELARKDLQASKPTAQYDIVDNSYTVSTLKISEELPNLSDVMAHPEKYEKAKHEPVIVDEQALLDNLTDVTFKPFDDGTRDYEVINDDIPTMSDIEKEFSQFDNFSIIESSEEHVEEQASMQAEEQTKELAEEQAEVIIEESSAKKLLEKIKKRRKERRAIEALNVEKPKLQEPVDKTKTSEEKKEIQCFVEGVSFKVIDTANFTSNTGCHLVENNDGYAVMAFVGDKLTKIKVLESIKIKKIQARFAEELSDGTKSYIVRIGSTKFIVKASFDSVSYVMDLC